jgi:hypothetical protein
MFIMLDLFGERHVAALIRQMQRYRCADITLDLNDHAKPLTEEQLDPPYPLSTTSICKAA